MADNSILRLIDALWTEQSDHWQMMQKGYKGLSTTISRDISYNGIEFRAQHNPARIVSSGAKVDKTNIAKRPCFLCPHSLGEEQKGVLLLGEYLFLINPFPILNKHFTIPVLQHVPQEFSRSRLLDMATIAEMLSGCYDVYFNGASAGASAPDHFHFQGGPQGILPLCESKCIETIWSHGNARISIVEKAPRKVLKIKAKDKEALVEAWTKTSKEIANQQLMNLVMRHKDGEWSLWVILRAKHRPECYHASGDDQMLVSPGVIDMCGIAVLSRAVDYERMTGNVWCELMDEVSMRDADFCDVVEALKR